MKHVFGPVPSRRLGRSLGIDLVPFKTCTFDCLYCQLGATGSTTVEGQESVEIDEVIAELREKLSTRPDYITMSGSGEPTLYLHLRELIERVRELTDIPVAVITNGSLLWDSAVRTALAAADLVAPSLDAGDEKTFRIVNRPHEDISFDRLVDGLVTFRREYGGQYWLEVLLLEGITDSEEQVGKIARIAARIKPDRVQLNTCVRPGADAKARLVEPRRLLELATLFSPAAEVIADYRPDAPSALAKAEREQIFSMLARRPCTAADVAAGLDVPLAEALKGLDQLLREGLVERSGKESGSVHYVRRLPA
jgi:wyosine [tRNA(Phe)-imidazoG37] synthetase (radical SAM superfamily)